MARNSFALNEAQKNGLTELMAKTRDTKPAELHGIYNEILETLKRGQILGRDAYQARYIRDAIAVDEKAKADFADIAEYLEKEFFG